MANPEYQPTAIAEPPLWQILSHRQIYQIALLAHELKTVLRNKLQSTIEHVMFVRYAPQNNSGDHCFKPTFLSRFEFSEEQAAAFKQYIRNDGKQQWETLKSVVNSNGQAGLISQVGDDTTAVQLHDILIELYSNIIYKGVIPGTLIALATEQKMWQAFKFDLTKRPSNKLVLTNVLGFEFASNTWCEHNDRDMQDIAFPTCTHDADQAERLEKFTLHILEQLFTRFEFKPGTDTHNESVLIDRTTIALPVIVGELVAAPERNNFLGWLLVVVRDTAASPMSDLISNDSFKDHIARFSSEIGALNNRDGDELVKTIQAHTQGRRLLIVSRTNELTVYKSLLGRRHISPLPLEGNSLEKLDSNDTLYWIQSALALTTETCLGFDVIIFANAKDDHSLLEKMIELLKDLTQNPRASSIERMRITLPGILLVNAGQAPELEHLRRASALISACKDTTHLKYVWSRELPACLADALPLCRSGTRRVWKFGEWLQQFRATERTLLLRLMKHFRFVGWDALDHICSQYLEAKTVRNGDNHKANLSILGGPMTKPSNYWFSYLGRPGKSAPAILSLISKGEWRRKVPNRTPRTFSYDRLARSLLAGILTGEQLCVVVVDDFVGSGGQLKSYFRKFFEQLGNEAITFAGRDLIDDVWNRIVEYLVEGPGQHVWFKALFAIGVGERTLEAIDGKIVGNGDPCAGARECTGAIDVPLPQVKDRESKKSIKSVNVQVHVADLCPDYKEVCELEGIDEETLKNILRKYAGIVKKRDKEHFIQFEPFGWKDTGGLTSSWANTQGNTLPIFWGTEPWCGKPWRPLFERRLNESVNGALDDPQKVLEGENWAEMEDYKKRMWWFVLNKRTDDQKLEELREEFRKKVGDGNDLAAWFTEEKEKFERIEKLVCTGRLTVDCDDWKTWECYRACFNKTSL